ncbi:MAG TPA: PH domain-containing protein [Candidatus Paceibacterota bacterium]|nr:PH domain-containing protein [Candidatus Paceibacterota bacterium]
MDIVFDTKYHVGKRTFVYLLFVYGWWLIVCGGALLYTALAITFGAWHEGMSAFLAAHPDWYTDTGMLGQWLAFAGLGFLIVAYLRASVLYRAHSFHVDDHALHLRRGLIRIQEITIPYHQINNIHIEQPYHWRMFGIAKLDITISSSHTELNKVRMKKDFLIPAIDKSLARSLAKFLTEQASGIDEEEYDEEEEEYESEEDGEAIILGSTETYE